MHQIEVGQQENLEISEPGLVAAGWRAYPDGLVELAPDAEGRSCVATAKAAGRTTVKATGADGQAVGHFSLVVTTPKPQPAPAATTPSNPTTATEAAHAVS